VLLLLPLVVLFTEALRNGIAAAMAALREQDAVAAIKLTVLVVGVAVPVNTAFGIAAAWCVAKFRFRGRHALLVLIELPLTVSPVVSGLLWLLLFGAQGWWGPALQRRGVHIVFAVPGIVLATLFVTFPFVVRTLVPLMEAQGTDQEEAATLLGAGFWPIFARVTVPDISGALLSGVLICTARALGEFGAVSVVSGHIPGRTETMPLQIETLYDNYQSAAAFALAAVLALMALVTLGAKSVLDWRMGRLGQARPAAIGG
jgi:sulfate transport system permease protein